MARSSSRKSCWDSRQFVFYGGKKCDCFANNYDSAIFFFLNGIKYEVILNI